MSDPESKIRFLGTTLDGQDWRATLLFEPSSSGISHAQRTAEKLRSEGFLVQMERDEDGHFSLTAHRTGHDTDWVGLFREYGVLKGATHTIENPLLPLSQLYHAAKDSTNGLIGNFTNPVRLGSLSYITADTLLSFAGAGNKDAAQTATSFFGKLKEKGESLKHAKNWTQSLGGTLFLLQSLIYMRFAKTGTEMSLDDMNKAYKQAEKDGKDLNDVESWTQDIGKDKHYLTPKIIRDYPIQMGAAIQNTGMALFMAHTFLEWRYKKGLLKTPGSLSAEDFKFADRYVNKGGVFVDAYRGIASFIGWALLMYPVKEHPHKSDNPVERAFQSFEENPQHASSIIATTTSLAGAASGTYFKGNMLQAAGELTYLPGDYLLSYANNSKYGKSDTANTEVIIDAVQTFISRSPMILGPDARREFACAIAEQMLKQSAAIETEKAKPEEREALKQRLAENHDIVIASLGGDVELEDARYDAFIEATRHLIVRFPVAERQAVAQQLTEALSQLGSVYVTPDEALKDIALDELAQTSAHHQPIRDIRELTQDISVLSNVIPGVSAGESASMLHDVLTPIIAGKVQTPKAQVQEVESRERVQPLVQQLAT